ncbi:MAG: hypothetical protein JWP19_1257 [Rhodoglobus sp.]|nr:hypothetical protein [Rhodoglobus sp.]
MLTGRQRGAAIFAGIFGHLLFALGWLGLGFLLLGGGLLLVFGASIGGIAGGFGDVQSISAFLSQAGAVIQVVGVVFGVISLLLMLLGFLVSGWILKGGRVRKPWATTLSAVVIAAVLDLPLFVLYLFIAGKLSDTNVSGPLFLGPFVFVVGTIIVGVLIWLWMTWGHRGPAVVVEQADGTPVAVTDSEAVSSIEAAEPVKAAEPD